MTELPHAEIVMELPCCFTIRKRSYLCVYAHDSVYKLQEHMHKMTIKKYIEEGILVNQWTIHIVHMKQNL